MTEDITNDFKQFITATIAQQTSHLATKDDFANLATKDDIANTATKDDIARLEQKINALETAVQHSAIGYTSTVDDQVQDHEQRIKRLEQKTA